LDPKIFIIHKIWHYPQNSAYALRSNFAAIFAAILLGPLALDQLTLCKIECLAAKKASE